MKREGGPGAETSSSALPEQPRVEEEKEFFGGLERGGRREASRWMGREVGGGRGVLGGGLSQLFWGSRLWSA